MNPPDFDDVLLQIYVSKKINQPYSWLLQKRQSKSGNSHKITFWPTSWMTVSNETHTSQPIEINIGHIDSRFPERFQPCMSLTRHEFMRPCQKRPLSLSHTYVGAPPHSALQHSSLSEWHKPCHPSDRWALRKYNQAVSRRLSSYFCSLFRAFTSPLTSFRLFSTLG